MVHIDINVHYIISIDMDRVHLSIPVSILSIVGDIWENTLIFEFDTRVSIDQVPVISFTTIDTSLSTLDS